MKTRLSFDSLNGFEIRLKAENLAEKAILHLLYEQKHKLCVNKITDYHESYKLIDEISIDEGKEQDTGKGNP